MGKEKKKEQFELLEAIYGPEGLEYVKIESPEWYGKLKKEIDEDGDSSIYGHGYVLGVVKDFNDHKIVAGIITGQDEVLKHFLGMQDKLEEIKEKWEEYKSFLQEKYPAKDGQEWEFTCDKHKAIDNILNS
jgi:hypothetical protein